jgi:hypothetical protein
VTILRRLLFDFSEGIGGNLSVDSFTIMLRSLSRIIALPMSRLSEDERFIFSK